VLVGSNPGGIRLELGVNFVRVFAIKNLPSDNDDVRCSYAGDGRIREQQGVGSLYIRFYLNSA